mmetsp:Transcript_128714/g.222374  ORF Transcript_128714/g.222374 Transcript_128714/m.222374 type:complete len:227 (+) Transcript_128714:302-982(+)
MCWCPCSLVGAANRRWVYDPVRTSVSWSLLPVRRRWLENSSQSMVPLALASIRVNHSRRSSSHPVLPPIRGPNACRNSCSSRHPSLLTESAASKARFSCCSSLMSTFPSKPPEAPEAPARALPTPSALRSLFVLLVREARPSWTSFLGAAKGLAPPLSSGSDFSSSSTDRRWSPTGIVPNDFSRIRGRRMALAGAARPATFDLAVYQLAVGRSWQCGGKRFGGGRC